MSLETEHKGYKVRYNENNDTWTCGDLEIYGMATLTAIKRKIDAIERRRRKTAVAVEAYKINHGGEIDRVYVTTMADAPTPKTSYSSYDNSRPGTAWVVRDAADVKSMAKARSKESIGDLIPATPENLAALEEYKRLMKVAADARKAAAAAGAAIPRYTYDGLMSDCGLKPEVEVEE